MPAYAYLCLCILNMYFFSRDMHAYASCTDARSDSEICMLWAPSHSGHATVGTYIGAYMNAYAYIGIANGMSIARVLACRYSK